MADLTRFVTAQADGGTYGTALAELRAGRKDSHWMWFVFPQLAGLGRSSTSQHYAVADLAEARDYLDHPVLGPRLVECAETLTALPGTDPAAVLGGIDAMKLRSSMTLFAAAATDPEQADTFRAVLDQYFDGEDDPQTLRLLGTGRRLVETALLQQHVLHLHPGRLGRLDGDQHRVAAVDHHPDAEGVAPLALADGVRVAPCRRDDEGHRERLPCDEIHGDRRAGREERGAHHLDDRDAAAVGHRPDHELARGGQRPRCATTRPGRAELERRGRQGRERRALP